ncbi:hypothetical protein EJ04DRAFT_517742 [Polyplosphaeria fusca]|uniref:Actin-like ATPase domain-containing protein n=1 Tax=Polyplosphaeria fusca TaxID=682080 RepID=A0A9P4QJA9_9PLEO|nr:hypothetical protein EJ04DRAFT_517742 [Polyplosphaeria fusca]
MERRAVGNTRRLTKPLEYRPRPSSGARRSISDDYETSRRYVPEDITDEDLSIPRAERSDPDPASILIGIDFGTTFSGVAWAYSEQPDDIKIVSNWDSQEWLNADKGKAPTRIAYAEIPPSPPAGTSRHSIPNATPSDSTTSLDNDGVSWGYGISDGEAVEWFKLLLLDEGDLDESHMNSLQIRRARQLLLRARKTPVEAVADYLRLLWAHALKSIEREFGEIALEGLPFNVVLTVPAVWTTKAVNRMRAAANSAGILDDRLAGQTTLHFVSEPEAAALATFDDLKARPNFREGDTFVVCDAGGGTVDLISYKVKQVEPMQLVECVEGSGKLCGAVFLDQDFEELMKQIVGDAWDVPEHVIKRIVYAQWENGIKRGFDGQDRTWNITLPYECIERGAPRTIPLNKGHVSEIFEDVVSKIRGLVNDQIASVEDEEGRLPKAVVLVGGFGSCRYLYNVLNTENKPRGIEVYQSTGAKPWTAICRGAVIKAITNTKLYGTTITSRISRCSYGTLYCPEFIAGIHEEWTKWFDKYDGLNRTAKMKWYLRRGDNIIEREPVSMDVRLDFLCEDYDTTYPYETKVYGCSKRDPPLVKDENVKVSCQIRSGSGIEVSKLRKDIGADGKNYYVSTMKIEMTVIGTALEFRSFIGGEEIGHGNVDVDLDWSW